MIHEFVKPKIVTWKILAPNLRAFHQWFSAYNNEFKKFPSVTRDYVMHQHHLIGVCPPQVIGFLDGWETNKNLSSEYARLYLEQHGYDFNKTNYIEWANIYLVGLKENHDS